jgi:hypothetical protein
LDDGRSLDPTRAFQQFPKICHLPAHNEYAIDVLDIYRPKQHTDYEELLLRQTGETMSIVFSLVLSPKVAIEN